MDISSIAINYYLLGKNQELFMEIGKFYFQN